MSKPTHPTYDESLPNLNGTGWARAGMATKAWAKKNGLVLAEEPCGQYFRNAPGSKNMKWVKLYSIVGNTLSVKLSIELPDKGDDTAGRRKL